MVAHINRKIRNGATDFKRMSQASLHFVLCLCQRSSSPEFTCTARRRRNSSRQSNTGMHSTNPRFLFRHLQHLSWSLNSPSPMKSCLGVLKSQAPHSPVAQPGLSRNQGAKPYILFDSMNPLRDDKLALLAVKLEPRSAFTKQEHLQIQSKSMSEQLLIPMVLPCTRTLKTQQEASYDAGDLGK